MCVCNSLGCPVQHRAVINPECQVKSLMFEENETPVLWCMWAKGCGKGLAQEPMNYGRALQPAMFISSHSGTELSDNVLESLPLVSERWNMEDVDPAMRYAGFTGFFG